MLAKKSRSFWKRFRTLLLIAIITVTLGLYIYTLCLIHETFSHRVEIFEANPEELGLKAKTTTLISPDNIILKAWWIPSKKNLNLGIVILLHGMDKMDATSMLGHAKFLHEAGYVTFVLDMRAHGRSGGQRIGLAIEEPQDVNAALDWMKRQNSLTHLPIAILGISMGGATAICTAAKRPEVNAVISIGSFASVDRLFYATLAEKTNIPDGLLSLLTPFLHLSMATLFGDWPAKASPLNNIKKISPRPILIIHGADDNQIPVKHANLLANACGDNCQLWIVRDRGHIIYDGDLTDPKNRIYRQHILRFLSENLDTLSFSPLQQESTL